MSPSQLTVSSDSTTFTISSNHFLKPSKSWTSLFSHSATPLIFYSHQKKKAITLHFSQSIMNLKLDLPIKPISGISGNNWYSLRNSTHFSQMSIKMQRQQVDAELFELSQTFGSGNASVGVFNLFNYCMINILRQISNLHNFLAELLLICACNGFS